MTLKIYMATTFWFGLGKGQREYGKLTDPYLIQIADSVPNRLESYHYLLKAKTLPELKASGEKVFVDSGAFSAWTLGAVIDLDEYCTFLKDNVDIIRCEDGIYLASVLDGIGDPLLTWQNQMAMEQRGVKPLPCFHFGEDERYLEWYIEHYKYITIGGCVGRSSQDLMVWLDRIWSRYMMDAQGKAKLKVHGFGITSVPIMERYPWWSVDSTSWIQTASFGAITVPGIGSLHVSTTSPNKHDKGAHLTTLTEEEQRFIKARLIKEGFDPDYMATNYLGRATYNLRAYQVIEKSINDANAARQDQRHMRQELF